VSINLPPFSIDESNQFIDLLIGTGAVSPETRRLVLEKSEGNPYYIQELLHALIAQEVLVRDPQTNLFTEVRPITSLDLPDSLQSLLIGRIDRLSPDEKRVLQMAAVIGTQFWRNPLQALAGDSIPLRTHLTSLQRAELILERSQVPDLGMEYIFNSSLVRDVAYESLLNTQRVAFHFRLAEYLENIIDSQGQKRLFSLVAYHFRQAGQSKKEFFYTLSAAERARDVFANVEALEYYNRAIELLDQLETVAVDDDQRYAIATQRFEVINGRAEIQFRLGDIPSGNRDAQILLKLAREMPEDSTWLIDALLLQPEVNNIENKEQLKNGIPIALEALSLAQQIGDTRREMRALLAIASQRLLMQDPTWQETAERALGLARQIHDPGWEVNILLGMGSAFGMDSLDRSLQYLEAALPISQKLGDKGIELSLLSVIGAQYERTGDYYRLLKDYEEKRLRISREIGNHLSEGNALMFCAQIQGIYLGDYEKGLEMSRQAARLWEPILGRLFPLLRIAQIQIALGNFTEAREILEQTRPLSEKTVDFIGRAGMLLIQALLFNTIGGEENLRSVPGLVEEIRGMVGQKLVSRQYLMAACCEETLTFLRLATLVTNEEERLEIYNKALLASGEALSIYESFGFVQIIECVSDEILYRHSMALRANNRQDEADEYLQKAYDEMMRKYDLIPSDSPFRRTYLQNISLHKNILATHEGRFQKTK
jgi:predicted ATPase